MLFAVMHQASVHRTLTTLMPRTYLASHDENTHYIHLFITKFGMKVIIKQVNKALALVNKSRAVQ